MTAKEYASAMREECYRQNKDIMEVTADLWIEIADNIENLANQAVEDYKNAVIEQIEKVPTKTIETYSEGYPMEEDFLSVCDVLKILKSAANATNGKNGG